MTAPYAVGVSLDGAGDAPGAWRLQSAPDLTAFDGSAQRAAAQRADAAGLVFATLDDALALQEGGPELVRGRLDALATACWLAPQTRRLGLLPTVTLTHTEPFHVGTATASLDLVSEGRGGFLATVSTGAAAAANVGRRGPAPADLVWAQAQDVVEVVRRLWDSWQDDAEIRDVATGRFLDRERLHYVDAPIRGADPDGDGGFSVRGPSIVPRPPQGQPLVAVRVPPSSPSARWRTAQAQADLVLLSGVADTQETAQQLRAGARDDLRVLGSLRVVLADDEAQAQRRAAELDADGPATYVGTPSGLAELLALSATAHGGWLDGVELRPAVLTDDLDAIADGLVPLLRARGLLADSPAGATLRDRLGLPRPASRYLAVTP